MKALELTVKSISQFSSTSLLKPTINQNTDFIEDAHFYQLKYWYLLSIYYCSLAVQTSTNSADANL